MLQLNLTVYPCPLLEKHAVLESVLSGRSGGIEPCTRAGLPLEDAMLSPFESSETQLVCFVQLVEVGSRH